MAPRKESTEAPAGGGMKSLIMAALGVILLGAGGGFGAAMVLIPPAAQRPANSKTQEQKPPAEKPSSAVSESGSTKPKDGAVAEPAVPLETVLLPLQPIVTNLKEPKDVWIRLEGSLVIRKPENASPSPDLALRMSQHVMAYLRTLKLSDFEGSQGLYAVNQDMNEIAVSLSNGLAAEVLIASLVLE